MECLAKIVKRYNYFSKVFYLRSLAELWIRPSFNKYSLTCKVTSGYASYETYSKHWHIQNPVYYRKFRFIQAYSSPYMREEKFLICNLLNMVKLTFCFFFSGIKHVFRHFSRRRICEICSVLTIKTPEYVKLTIKLKIKTPLTSFWSPYC